MRFLSHPEQRHREEELDELETDRAERDEEDQDIMDLEPVPTSHNQQKPGNVDNLDGSSSDDPLIR